MAVPPPAYYSASSDTFAAASIAHVVGELTLRSEFAVEEAQRDAWANQVLTLQQCLAGVRGAIFLEYVVPRIGSRIDAVIILGAAIVVIEFKVGAGAFARADENQVWDYALDLKNFHLGSHEAPIIPLLVATEAPDQPLRLPRSHPDRVYRPIRTPTPPACARRWT